MDDGQGPCTGEVRICAAIQRSGGGGGGEDATHSQNCVYVGVYIVCVCYKQAARFL